MSSSNAGGSEVMIEPESESVRERRTLPASNRIMLRVNGVERHLDVAPWTTLLDALREQLDLTGTRKGCDHGQCGACTVLVEGKRINSCLTLAVDRKSTRLNS